MINFLSGKKGTQKTPTIIGITGDAGKTIVTHLIKDILLLNGYRVGFISSEGSSTDGSQVDTSNKANKISKKEFKNILNESQKLNTDFFIVEMPYSSIKKNVYHNITIDAGVITNVEKIEDNSRERLNFINYFNEGALLVVSGKNIDFVNWLETKSEDIENSIYCYWVDTKNLSNKQFKKEGIEYSYYNEAQIFASLHGNYNFENTYLALRVCGRYLPLNQIVSSLRNVSTVSGKLDLTQEKPFSIFIDEAKNSRQLEGSITHIASIKGPTQKLVTVIGVSDSYKDNSYEIGTIVARYSDIVILAPADSNTTQTPDLNSLIHNGAESFRGRLIERIYSTEELEMLDKKKLMTKIFNTMQAGDVPVISFDAHNHTGRLDAFKLAIMIADNDDIVYIAGKGSEESITFDNVEYEWSDYEALNLVMNS